MRLLHPFDRFRPWFREFARYHRHLSWLGFWVRYETYRMWAKEHEPQPWHDEREIRSHYAQNHYLLYRQVYYHRDRSFRWLRKYLPPAGKVCEYGCGVAPAISWLASHGSQFVPGGHFRLKQRYEYTLVDIPNPAFAYARWRLDQRGIRFTALSPGLGNALPLREAYDTILCLEVLEHVPNPDEVVRHLIAHLSPGGYLLLNFVDGEPQGLNLASAQRQRKATLELLRGLDEVRPMDRDGGGTGVYRAPMDNARWLGMRELVEAGPVYT